jgi:hypothetical protein
VPEAVKATSNIYLSHRAAQLIHLSVQGACDYIMIKRHTLLSSTSGWTHCH